MCTKGTPTTLLQAIQNGLDHDKASYPADVIKAHVRDFLAQHFSKPMLEASPEESAKFKALFDRIVK